MRKLALRFVGICMLLVLLAQMAPASPAVAKDASTPDVPYVPGTVLLKFRSDVASVRQEEFLKAHGLEVVGKVYGDDVLILKAAEPKVTSLVEKLNQHPYVAYAEPDYIATISWTPNDPYWSQQWGPKKINTTQAWDVTRGSSSVMIAVVDTGVDLDHPDLRTKVRTDIDYDFVNNDSTAQDDNGHGTHVAGIAAAATNNSTGVAGTCPNCSILPVKVLNASGSGSYSAIASGIRYAADKGAKVINLSLGGSAGSSTLESAVNYANSKGSLLICAAGNENTSAPSYPAYYSACVAVAATDQNDRRASFSNYGSWVDVSAPGVSIYSTYWNDRYASLSGTSMATPHVAGVAGLLFSQGRSQSAVRTRLTSSTYTDPVNSTGIPRRVNAYKAVAY